MATGIHASDAPPEESVLGPRSIAATKPLNSSISDLGNTVRRSFAPLLFLACAALALIEGLLRTPKR